MKLTEEMQARAEELYGKPAAPAAPVYTPKAPAYRDAATVPSAAVIAGRDSSAGKARVWDNYVQTALRSRTNPNPFTGQAVRYTEVPAAAPSDTSAGKQRLYDNYVQSLRTYINNPTPQMAKGWESSAGRQRQHDMAMRDVTNPDIYTPGSIDWYLAQRDRAMGLNAEEMRNGIVYSPAETVETIGGAVTLPQKYYYTGDDKALSTYAEMLNREGLTAGTDTVLNWQRQTKADSERLRDEALTAQEKLDQLVVNYGSRDVLTTPEYLTAKAEAERLASESEKAEETYKLAESFGTEEQLRIRERYDTWLASVSKGWKPTDTEYFSGVYDQAEKTVDAARADYEKWEAEYERLATAQGTPKANEEMYRRRQLYGLSSGEEWIYQENIKDLAEIKAQRDRALEALADAQEKLMFAESVRYEDIRLRPDFEKLAAAGAYTREHSDDWERADYEAVNKKIEETRSEINRLYYLTENGTASEEERERLGQLKEQLTALEDKRDSELERLRQLGLEKKDLFGRWRDYITGEGDKREAEEKQTAVRDVWTEAEKKTFDALTAAGKSEEAKAYAVSVNKAHNQTNTAGQFEWGKAEGKSAFAKAGRAIAGAAAQVVTSPLEIPRYISQLKEIALTGDTTGSDKPRLSERAQAITAGAAAGLNELGTLPSGIPIVGGRGLGDLYQVAISSLQSLGLGLTMGEVGTLAVFAAQGGAGAMDEAMARGATGEEAVLFSALSGAIEVLTEKVSLENLLNGDYSANALKGILKQSGIEGSEEFSAAVLEQIADRATMGYKAQYAQRVTELIAGGNDPATAREQAKEEIKKDIAWDTVAGMISGGMSSATHYAATAAGNAVQGRILERQAAAVETELKGYESAQKDYESALETLEDENSSEEEKAKAEETAASAREIIEKTEERYGKVNGYADIPTARGIAEFDGKRGKVRAWAYNDGKFIVSFLSDDKSVDRAINADELYFDRGTQYLFEKAKENPEIGAEMLNAYLQTGGQNPGIFANAFISAANIYGRQTDVSEEEAWKNVQKNGHLSYEITRRQFGQAFRRGRELKDNEELGIRSEELSEETRQSGAESAARSEELGIRNEELSEETRQSGAVDNAPEIGRRNAEASAALTERQRKEEAESGTVDNAQEIGRRNAEASAALTERQRKEEAESGTVDNAQEIGRRNAEASAALTERQRKEEAESGTVDNAQESGTVDNAQESGRRNAEASAALTERQRKREGQVRYEAVSADGRNYEAAGEDDVSEETRQSVNTLAKLIGVDFVFYKSKENEQGLYKGANGFYRDGTVYLDVHAGANKSTEESAVLLTAAHELTHHIRAENADGYIQLRNFVTNKLIGEGTDLVRLAKRKIDNSPNPSKMTLDDAIEEVVADSCEEMLLNTKLADELVKENPQLAEQIRNWVSNFADKIKKAVSPNARRHGEAVTMRKYAEQLQEIWDKALAKASRSEEQSASRSEELSEGEAEQSGGTIAGFAGKAEQNTAKTEQSGTKESVREIVDEDGNDYGLGVYLDSTLLENLTDDERKQMVRERVAELGGNRFTAIDQNGNEVLIDIAEPNRTFRNRKGKRKYVNQDLIRKLNDNKLKQETVVLADELIETSKYKNSRAASYSHGWLDNNGKNNWEEWTVYVQDKNNTVWNAMLHIANSEDGKKYLYDIGPIRKAASPGRSGASTTTDTVPQTGDGVKQKNSNRDRVGEMTEEEREDRDRAYTRLKRENMLLQERLRHWKGQTKKTTERTVDRKATWELARELKKKYGSKADVGMIQESLNLMGDMLLAAGEGNVNYELLYEEGMKTATELFDGIDIVLWDEKETREGILSYLKSFPINLRPLIDAGELTTDWVKAHSEIVYRRDGQSIDSAYSTLAEMYPGFFDPELSDGGDMAEAIAQIIDDLQPVTGNPYERNAGEMINEIWNDIIDEVITEGIKETPPTAADKYEEKLKAAEERRVRELNELREKNNERIKQLQEEGTERRLSAVARERERGDRKTAKVREYYRKILSDRKEKQTERKGTKKYKARVLDKLNTLSEWMLKNSDREHIPESMKETIANLISAIDTSSRESQAGKRETRKDISMFSAMSRLQEAINRQKDYFDGKSQDWSGVYMDFSGEVKQIVGNLLDKIRAEADAGRSYNLEQMSAEELKELAKVLDNVLHAVRNANRVLAGERKRTIGFLGQKFFLYSEKLGKAKERSALGERAATAAWWDNLVPVFAFKRFGEAGEILFGNLRKGWGQMARNCIEILNFTRNLYTAEEARVWQREIHEVTLANGESFRITTAQLMSLYCLNKREQALKHLEGGGLRVGDIEIDGDRFIRQTDHFKPGYADLARLTGKEYLNDRQREVADALQRFMSRECADWGNAVSMARYGYRALGEDNYFPITSDSNLFAAEDPERKSNDMFRLLNMSATKALEPNANNALVVGDIFRVFTDHATDMAKYNALALPLLDLIKWLNYKESYTDSRGKVFAETVQKTMEKCYGAAAERYVVQFIKDLNGVHESGSNTTDRLTKGIISRYKASSVGMNMRVIVQQPTSYVRASLVIPLKYLAKGLKPKKSSIDEMLKYSDIAKWKNLGFVSTDIGKSIRDQIMHTETALDRLQDKQMAGAEWADKITWGALWQACKAKVSEEEKLTGEELLKRTAEVFEDMIYQTQVVDATMTRSHNMRNPGVLNAITTAFMAEPTLSYNIVMDAVSDYVTARRMGEGLKAARERIAKSLLVYCMSGAATVLAASAWDAFRDDDDYETWLQKFKSALWGDGQSAWYDSNIMQELIILNKIPVIKDIWGLFAQGETPDRMDMQVFTNLKKAWDIDRAAILSVLGKGESPIGETGLTVYGAAMSNLRAFSQMSGLAFYNLTRDAIAVYNTFIAPVTGEKLRSYEKSDRQKIKSAYLSGFMDEEHAAEELMKTKSVDDRDQAFWVINDWNGDGSSSDKMKELFEAIRTGTPAQYDTLLRELTSHGVHESAIQAEVRGKIKEWYQGTETQKASLDKKKALDYVTRFGGKSGQDAEQLVQQWTCEKVEGIEYGKIGEEYINGNITEAEATRLLNTYGYAKPKSETQREENAGQTRSRIMQWKLYRETGIEAGGESFPGIREAYNAGDIGKAKVIEYRMKYAGDDREKAEKYAYRYEWIGGDASMNSATENQCRIYDEYLSNSGIGKKQYYGYITEHPADSFSGELKPGSTTSYIANSKRDKIWAYIDSLNLSPAQKDALAQAYARLVKSDVKSTSNYLKLQEAPWRKRK